MGRSKRELKKLKDIARRERSAGARSSRDVRFRDRIAQVEIEILALEVTNLRVLSEEGKHARARPGLDPQGARLGGSSNRSRN